MTNINSFHGLTDGWTKNDLIYIWKDKGALQFAGGSFAKLIWLLKIFIKVPQCAMLQNNTGQDDILEDDMLQLIFFQNSILQLQTFCTKYSPSRKHQPPWWVQDGQQ